MGKSGASCFRIIGCGSNSVNQDGEALPESKSSGEGCGWSFWKRSSRHRVLSNTVVVEVPPSSANKESLEYTNANFQVQPNSKIPEKSNVVQMTQEKKDLPAETGSGLSETIISREDDGGTDATVDESSIIIIQTAIRTYLAQQALLKEKNAIKLQAAVRGHLVRRHAAGTLRCIQAIVKIQTLVRKRRICVLDEGPGDSETETNIVNPLPLRGAGSVEPIGRSTSIEKLLSNKFARQLMESTPRTNPINIKCEPLKSDSAWKWLERWMSVSTVINEKPHESVPTDFKCILEPSENDELITYDADKFDHGSCSSIPPSSGHVQLQEIDKSDSGLDITQSDPTETNETPMLSRVETDKEDTTSGHEELIPAANTFSNPTSLLIDSPKVQSSFNNSVLQAARSECGTELSVSSTLDSPDRPENECTLHVKAYDISHVLGTELSYINTNQLERDAGVDSVSEECGINNIATDLSQVEKTPEEYAEYQNEGQAMLSVQTPPEPEKSTGEKCESKHSNKRLLDSPPRSGSEAFHKQNRNSVSVPSYMQVTESARAKAVSNGSPRLSPDVQDGKNKRSNVRQGSPRVHRSPSQAQANVKGHGIHSPQERKWRV